jgi:phosphate-selective porin OprO/OprP
VILSKAHRKQGKAPLLWGGCAQLSYFLTGEERRYVDRQSVFGRVAIRDPVSFGRGTWGAWELTARYSYLDFDDAEVRGGSMSDVTIGLASKLPRLNGSRRRSSI